MPDFRKIGDILQQAVGRLEGGDQGRAYLGWSRAVGPDIAAATAPRRFARGTLVVSCASSVWANELTYLAPQILSKMASLDPETPVKRLRFEPGGWPPRQGE